MTAQRSQHAVASGVPTPSVSDTRPRPRRLTWWVSPDAVRQAIGAWAATARVGRARPATELVRTSVGVACAIAELAAAEPWDADTLPLRARADVRAEDAGRDALTRAVAYDPSRLGELSGASMRDVDRALDVLRQAGVVSQTQGVRGALVLGADYVAVAPAVAAITWSAVRERLSFVAAPIAAPCAVLRALAERLGAVDLSGGTDTLPSVRVSVRELELVTEFRRSTVGEAIASLGRARLLDADARAGHTGRFVIRPVAFGLPDDEPWVAGVEAVRPQSMAAAAVPVANRIAQAPLAGEQAVKRAVGTTPAPTALGSSVLVGTFAGTPIYAPQGTPLVVECDTEGRWSCRVGPFLQLGPVAG